MVRKLWDITSAKEKCTELDVELLSESYSGTEKLLFRCRCGNEFKKMFSNILLNQNHCPECGMKKKEDYNFQRRLTAYNELLDYVEDNMKGFKLLSSIEEYKNNKSKLRMICVCGDEFNPSALNIKSGSSKMCRKCSASIYGAQRRIDYDYINEYVKINKYSLIEREVRKSNSWIHVDCENEEHDSYWTSWSNFRNGNRCPQCNLSKGEEKIRIFFENKNIIFDREFKIEGLKGINEGLLRFDFCVYLNDKILLVEYDGEQHFKPKFGEFEFMRTVNNDNIKNKYCLENNIELLRIPYTEFENIEKILSKRLINQADAEITNT